MSPTPMLPEFPDDWEKTRATLHAYSRGVGAIPRAYAESHPKWWHVSLTVGEDGLVTDPIPLPGGETMELRMDLRSHDVVVSTSAGDVERLSMTGGLTGTEFADHLIQIASGYGLEEDYHREKFENDEPREYDPAAAELFLTTLRDVNAVFEKHRAGLDGDVSPVQLWPHGFDLAMEWFGTRTETYEENGETQEHRAQLNLGFYPAGDMYFYSNPWPFEADLLVDKPLPHGAEWTTESFEGTILYYEKLQGDPEAERKLLEYAAAVFAAAAPTLED